MSELTTTVSRSEYIGLRNVARHLVADFNRGSESSFVEWEDLEATRDLASSIVGDNWVTGEDGILVLDQDRRQ